MLDAEHSETMTSIPDATRRLRHKAEGRAATIRRLQPKLDELEALFDLEWKADQRAIACWQASTGETLVWPDRAKLLLWLLERLACAEAVIDSARSLGKRTIQRGELTERTAEELDIVLRVVSYDQAYPRKLVERKAEG